jgi:hypothetical protein
MSGGLFEYDPSVTHGFEFKKYKRFEEALKCMKFYPFRNNPNAAGKIIPSVKAGTCIGLPAVKTLLFNKIVKVVESPVLYDMVGNFDKNLSMLCAYGPDGSGIRTVVMAMLQNSRVNLLVLSGELYVDHMFECAMEWAVANQPCAILFDHFLPFDVRVQPNLTSLFFHWRTRLVNSTAKVWFIFSPGEVPNKVYNPTLLTTIGLDNMVYAHPMHDYMIAVLYETFFRRYTFRALEMTSENATHAEAELLLYSQISEEKLTSLIYGTLVQCSTACTPRDIESYTERVFLSMREGMILDEMKEAIAQGGVAFPDFSVFANCMNKHGTNTTIHNGTVLPHNRHMAFMMFKDSKYEQALSVWRRVSNGYDRSLEDEDADLPQPVPVETASSSSSSSSSPPPSLISDGESEMEREQWDDAIGGRLLGKNKRVRS